MIAAIFDLEGTLAEVSPGYEPDLVRRSWQRLTGDNYTLEQAQAFLGLSFPEQVRYLLSLGFEDMKQFRSTWFTEEELDRRFQALDVCGDVDYLISLAEKGIKLGLVTSAKEEKSKSIVERIGKDLFQSKVYIEGDNFPDKPDPAALLYCMQQLDVSKAFYVGDQPKDVEFAVNAGITSVLIDRKGRVGNLSVQPDYKINSLYQLDEIIERI